MPKQRITKEMIIGAAFEIARKEGMDKVIVTTVAERLNCSVQPVYSYFKNMDDLRNSVAERAKVFVQEYVGSHMDTKDLFRSTGRAYVRIAKEEPYIFRLYIFQERKNISSLNELYRTETNPDIAKIVAANLNISEEAAQQFHLHMLIYTIGIGTIFSVTSSGIEEDEIFRQQEQAYEAFLKIALEENNHAQ